MTPFETASLEILRNTITVYWWQAAAMLATAVIAAVAAFIAIKSLWELVDQVKAANAANEIGKLNALLSLEQDMSQRRNRFGDLLKEVTDMRNSDAYKQNRALLEPVMVRYNETAENYLNALDRLCFCLLKGRFNEDELRPDYRDILREAIDRFKDKFGPGTRYRYVAELHDRWART